MRPPLVPHAFLPLKLDKRKRLVWTDLPGYEEAEKQWARMMLDYMRYLHANAGRGDTITQLMRSIDRAAESAEASGLAGLDSIYLAGVLRKYSGKARAAAPKGGFDVTGDAPSALLRLALTTNVPA